MSEPPTTVADLLVGENSLSVAIRGNKISIVGVHSRERNAHVHFVPRNARLQVSTTEQSPKDRDLRG